MRLLLFPSSSASRSAHNMSLNHTQRRQLPPSFPSNRLVLAGRPQELPAANHIQQFPHAPTISSLLSALAGRSQERQTANQIRRKRVYPFSFSSSFLRPRSMDSLDTKASVIMEKRQKLDRMN